MSKRPKLSSTSRIFEKRGDPWVSNKEGIKDFGRTPEIENVERDAETQRLSSDYYESLSERKRKDALIRTVGRDTRPKEPDFMTRITNARMQFRRKEREGTINIVHPPPKASSKVSTKVIKRNYKRPEFKSNTPGIKG